MSQSEKMDKKDLLEGHNVFDINPLFGQYGLVFTVK